MNLKRYTTLFLLLATAQLFSQTWKAIPAPVAEISCIRTDPHRPGMVYFVGKGVISGTSDGGATWIYKSFSGYANLLPRDLLIDVDDSTRWYMAVDAAGYMRSTNSGETWQFINEGLHQKNWWYFKQLIQDRTRPQIMYLVSSERVYKSTDRGESWKSMLAVFTASGAKDEASALLINQDHPDSLYVFAKETTPKRWISGDQGRSWSPDSSYVGGLETFTFTKEGGLLVGSWRSMDYGSTWINYKKLAGGGNTSPAYDAISSDISVYDTDDELYFLGCYAGLYFKRPDDVEWQPTEDNQNSEGFLGKVTTLHYDAYSKTLWGIQAYRLFKSTDGGRTVTYLDSGLFFPSTGFLSTHDYKGGIIIGDNVSTLNNGQSWDYIGRGLGEEIGVQQGAVSPIDSLFIVWGYAPMGYTTTGHPGYDVKQNDWKLSQPLYTAMPTGLLHFNPHNPHELFGGNIGGLWRISDSAIINIKTPTTISPWLLTPRLSNGNLEHGWQYICMCFHPKQDDIYFLCTVESDMLGDPLSTLRKTTDRGVTWVPLLDQLSRWYADICVNPNDPDIVVIASKNGILRSVDGGRTWTQNYRPPFQSAIIKSVIIDPRYPSVYYCGAGSVSGDWTHWDTGLRSGGMYVSYDYGETWEALPIDGMHNVSVRFIHYHENPRRLIVSTWAGIYEMLLPEYTTNTTPVPESSTLDVRVYPNPATSGTVQTLTLRGANGKHAVVDLYSIHGRRVARVHEGVLGAETTLRQQTAQFPAGVYYYRVLVGGEQRSVPVVISR